MCLWVDCGQNSAGETILFDSLSDSIPIRDLIRVIVSFAECFPDYVQILKWGLHEVKTFVRLKGFPLLAKACESHYVWDTATLVNLNYYHSIFVSRYLTLFNQTLLEKELLWLRQRVLQWTRDDVLRFVKELKLGIDTFAFVRDHMDGKRLVELDTSWIADNVPYSITTLTNVTYPRKWFEWNIKQLKSILHPKYQL